EEDSNFIFKPICCIAAKLDNEHLGKELFANVLSYNFKSELLDVNIKNTNIHQKILGANHINSFSQYVKHRIQKLERMLDNLDNNSTPNISVSSYIKEKQDYIKQIENLEKEVSEYNRKIDAFKNEKNMYIKQIKKLNKEIK
ncbi:1891_t:CDS:1, partial [Gigaspora margarita]